MKIFSSNDMEDRNVEEWMVKGKSYLICQERGSM